MLVKASAPFVMPAGLCLGDLAAQLREQGGVDAEAFDAFVDEGFALFVGQRCLVEQFAVAILEDLGLGQFGEAVHTQCFGGDAVVAADQRCDCLATGEVAEVAQVVVCEIAFGGVDGGADALYVFCGCGQGRVDVAVLAECADVCADVFCAVEAGVNSSYSL